MGRFKRLLVEVHQRSVWQALAVYLGASYAVLEAAAYFRDEFGLPDWLPPVALVLLLIGLPVVVVTSLAREEVYGGEVPAADAAAAAEEDRRLRLLTWRTAGLSFLGALALWGIIAAGLLFTGTYERVRSDERRSIAVLPFENLSPDPDDAYFADGIHEEIISQLSKIASLRVISRTSVMEYRDREANLRTIADELDVTHVLEGSVRRAGDDVRITTQLIVARDDAHLWAESYERELRGVFEVQADVARQVTAALRAALDPEEIARIEAQPTDNPEAYDLYLRALSGGGGRIELLERAVELDSTFALAYAALSEVHVSMFYQQADRSTERLEMALQTGEKARQLDPDLPEAYWALARYYSERGDEERAASARREAIRLDPNSVRALRQKASDLWNQGRREEAMVVRVQALARDPRDAVYAYNIAARFHYLHDFENAERYYDHAISLGNSAAMGYKALLYLAWSGDTAKARAALGGEREACGFLTWQLQDATDRLCDESQLERRLSQSWGRIVEEGSTSSSAAAVILITRAGWHGRRGETEQERAAYDSARIVLEPIVQPDDATMRSGLGIAYAGLGRREEAIREGQRAVELVGDTIWYYQRPSRVLNLARIYMMVGDYDAAVQQLETLPADRGLVTPAWLGADPLWEPLRDHPRFQALLAKHE